MNQFETLSGFQFKLKNHIWGNKIDYWNENFFQSSIAEEIIISDRPKLELLTETEIQELFSSCKDRLITTERLCA